MSDEILKTSFTLYNMAIYIKEKHKKKKINNLYKFIGKSKGACDHNHTIIPIT